MKILGTLCTLALFLFLIVPTPGYSQDRDENKPNQQDEQRPKDNDKGKQEDKTARPDDSRRNDNPNMGRQDDRQKPEANRPQEQQREQQQREQRPAEQQRPMDNNNRRAQDINRDQNQHRAADRGRRIPEEQFRSHFGREHHFHVQRDRVVNVSQPVVVYGGYSWQLAEPWPSVWSYDDDCYIDEIDGEYFLFDVLHPGIRVAVFIVE